jgi:hypothetical protein
MRPEADMFVIGTHVFELTVGMVLAFTLGDFFTA